MGFRGFKFARGAVGTGFAGGNPLAYYLLSLRGSCDILVLAIGRNARKSCISLRVEISFECIDSGEIVCLDF